MFRAALKDLLGLGIALRPEQVAAYERETEFILVPSQIEHPVHMATCGCGDPNPMYTSDGKLLVMPMVVRLPKKADEVNDLMWRAEDAFEDIAFCCPSVLGEPQHITGGNMGWDGHLVRAWDAIALPNNQVDHVLDVVRDAWSDLGLMRLEELGALYGDGEVTREVEEYLAIEPEEVAKMSEEDRLDHYEWAQEAMYAQIEMDAEEAERDLTPENVKEALEPLNKEARALWRGLSGTSRQSWDSLLRRVEPGRKREFVYSEGTFSPWL